MSEQFPYRAKPGTMLLAGAFFGACAAFGFYKAATNEQGMIINGLIELGPRGASVFWLVLAIVSALFVLTAVVAVIHGLVTKSVLVLGEDYLVVPAGNLLKRRAVRIDFRDLRDATLQDVAGQQFLALRTTDTKVTITRSLLSPDTAFDRLHDVIRARLPRS